MLIKVFLVGGILLFGALALRVNPGPRHLAIRRAAVTLILAFGVTAVLFPALVTGLANLMGVGRGTDLVLYVLSVVFLLTTVATYRRLAQVERRYVRLARKVAIMEALAAPHDHREGALDAQLRSPSDHQEMLLGRLSEPVR